MNNQYIDPNQVAQMTQPQMANPPMTDAELQKTQVLNLEDVKATARIEKLSSKKPAIFFAILGIVLIVTGAFYPNIKSSLNGKNKAEDNIVKAAQRVDKEKEEEPTEEENTQVLCTKEVLNNPNGMDELLSVTVIFQEEQLVGLTKTYTFRKTTTETPDTEQTNYLTALQPYITEAETIEGYDVTVQELQNESVTTTNVDYSKLVYETITEKYQTNYRFSIPFQSTATIEEVKTELVTEGYICNE